MHEIELTNQEIAMMRDSLIMVTIRIKQGTRSGGVETIAICESILAKLEGQ